MQRKKGALCGRRPPPFRVRPGTSPMAPLKAIRLQLNEIRLCRAVNCALSPFRAGKRPWWGEGEKSCQPSRIPSGKPSSRTGIRATTTRRQGVHTASELRHSHPRLDRLAGVDQVLDVMRKGEALHLHYELPRTDGVAGA